MEAIQERSGFQAHRLQSEKEIPKKNLALKSNFRVFFRQIEAYKAHVHYRTWWRSSSGAGLDTFRVRTGRLIERQYGGLEYRCGKRAWQNPSPVPNARAATKITIGSFCVLTAKTIQLIRFYFYNKTETSNCKSYSKFISPRA